MLWDINARAMVSCRWGAHTTRLGRGVEDMSATCMLGAAETDAPLSKPHKLHRNQAHGAFSVFLCSRTFYSWVPFSWGSLFSPLVEFIPVTQSVCCPCQAHFKADEKHLLMVPPAVSCHKDIAVWLAKPFTRTMHLHYIETLLPLYFVHCMKSYYRFHLCYTIL